MDFTLKTYCRLLDAFTDQNHNIQTFAEYIEAPVNRSIILRHDVEARYGNALQFARIQHEQGISGTYYFRILPDHFDKDIIREIAAMGHEIGYHYDDLSYCHGNYEKAIQRFEKNLSILREIAPVKTICMEGAPLSKWDNRALWGESAVRSSQFAVRSSQSYTENRNPESGTRNYRDFGIIGEPYFDIDFSKVLYLTDTGRRWDGKGSVRDKVQSSKFKVQSESSQLAVGSQLSSNPPTADCRPPTANLAFRSTNDIIAAARAGLLPDQVMFTFHPQRWNDKPLPWLQELVMQNVKNTVKRLVLRVKG